MHMWQHHALQHGIACWCFPPPFHARSSKALHFCTTSWRLAQHGQNPVYPHRSASELYRLCSC